MGPEDLGYILLGRVYNIFFIDYTIRLANALLKVLAATFMADTGL